MAPVTTSRVSGRLLAVFFSSQASVSGKRAANTVICAGMPWRSVAVTCPGCARPTRGECVGQDGGLRRAAPGGLSASRGERGEPGPLRQGLPERDVGLEVAVGPRGERTDDGRLAQRGGAAGARRLDDAGAHPVAGILGQDLEVGEGLLDAGAGALGVAPGPGQRARGEGHGGDDAAVLVVGARQVGDQPIGAPLVAGEGVPHGARQLEVGAGAGEAGAALELVHEVGVIAGGEGVVERGEDPFTANL